MDFNHIVTVLEKSRGRKLAKVKATQEKKFRNLQCRLGIPIISNARGNNVIFNYSHRTLTKFEKDVLSRGLRFCLPPRQVDQRDMKCSFELLFRELHQLNPNLGVEDRDYVKCHLKDAYYTHIRSYDFQNYKNILSQQEWSVLRALRQDSTISIMKPDKGNGVVILNKTDYISKLNVLLRDESKFRTLESDPTATRERSLRRFLGKLKSKGSIDDSTYSSLYPNGSQPALMYGLPKVHKPNAPLRPIVSSLNTYNYNLAKYLVQLLKPTMHNPTTIKDTFAFVDWMKQCRSSGNSILCSFEVTSLFTNVPVEETIQLCINRILNVANPPNISATDLYRLFKYATKQSHFLVNGSYFDFVDGIAMGSPLAPIMAEIFMTNFEEQFIKNNHTPSSPSV